MIKKDKMFEDHQNKVIELMDSVEKFREDVSNLQSTAEATDKKLTSIITENRE